MSSLKTNFAVKSKYESFYTGGKVQITSDGVYMFCGCGNKVNILEIATGRIHSSIGESEDEVITSFCLTPDDKYVVLATQNLLLRQWNWKEKELVRTWKAIHFAPVTSMAFDATSTLLATGGADSTVKLWDIERQYCTHNLKGHQGVVNVVAFHPDMSRLLLYSAAEDYKVRVWSLKTSTCLTEASAHFSTITAIVFSKDGQQVFSSGRDGIVAVWDADKLKVIKTIPVFETVEALVLVPECSEHPNISVTGSDPHFITAGSKGILRVWNSRTSRCVYQTKEVHSKPQVSVDNQSSTGSQPSTNTQADAGNRSSDDSQNILQMVYNSTLNSVAVITFDQNISLLGLDKLHLKKQFAGNTEEILAVKYFGPEEKYVLVATNSRYLKLFQLDSWDCEILYGHTDIVLAIDTVATGNRFISSGKDNTVRLWEIDPAKKLVSCLAVGQGHTYSVGALGFARLKPTFFVSGSEDSTLKVWHIPSDLDPSTTLKLQAAATERAHEKSISCVEVSPNDMFVASGSMDKTAKLWRTSDLKLLGVMRGHRRGIWSLQFSPVDQILATASGDTTVKLWSLTDFSCVMTFEGHISAVLHVSFINRGMQFLSSSTDGIVKLWTIKTNECVRTLDEHADKVWSLAVNRAGDSFISGAADSSLIVWQDVTETEQNEARQKQEQLILQEQELSNLLQQKKYLKAIGLAITLEQPFRVLNIMKEILSETDGDDKLVKTIEKLRMDQVDALLRFAGQWNTNSRHCHEAQFVLSAVLRMHPPEALRALANIKSSLEGLLPYTDRHFQRLSRLMQQSMFLEYTWHCMKNVSTDRSYPLSDQVDTNFTKKVSPPVAQGTSDSSTSESEEDMDLPTTTSSNKTLTEKKLKSDKFQKDKVIAKIGSEKHQAKDERTDVSEDLDESEENNNQPMKTPRLNLFKAYSREDAEDGDMELDKKQQKSNKKEKKEKNKKRKITDICTVVKKKGKVEMESETFYIDKQPLVRTVVEEPKQIDLVSIKKTKPIIKLKSNNKLKKPKKLSR